MRLANARMLNQKMVPVYHLFLYLLFLYHLFLLQGVAILLQPQLLVKADAPATPEAAAATEAPEANPGAPQDVRVYSFQLRIWTPVFENMIAEDSDL